MRCSYAFQKKVIEVVLQKTQNGQPILRSVQIADDTVIISFPKSQSQGSFYPTAALILYTFLIEIRQTFISEINFAIREADF